MVGGTGVICHADGILPHIAISTAPSIVKVIYKIKEAIIVTFPFIVPRMLRLILWTSFTYSRVDPHIAGASVHQKANVLSRCSEADVEFDIVTLVVNNVLSNGVFFVFMNWNIIMCLVMPQRRISGHPIWLRFVWVGFRLVMVVPVNFGHEFYTCVDVTITAGPPGWGETQESEEGD